MGAKPNLVKYSLPVLTKVYIHTYVYIHENERQVKIIIIHNKHNLLPHKKRMLHDHSWYITLKIYKYNKIYDIIKK